MQATITGRLKNLNIEAPQAYRNITIFPLVDGDGSGGVDYLTLGEALEKKLLTVTEVSESGSVPELRVVNAADAMVLLLDGEELIGAKQNRVLNTTVLVAAGQTLTIPVSCTEQGRWRYVSPSFERSDTLMVRDIRMMKSLSVSASLQTEQSYRSDQAEFWSKLRRLEMSAGVESPTGAMHDIFESYGESLGEALQYFQPLPGQLGILVVIDGKAAGLDLVSRAPAYARLHGKLVKSHVMEALVSRKAGREAEAGTDRQPDGKIDRASSAASRASGSPAAPWSWTARSSTRRSSSSTSRSRTARTGS